MLSLTRAKGSKMSWQQLSTYSSPSFSVKIVHNYGLWSPVFQVPLLSLMCVLFPKTNDHTVHTVTPPVILNSGELGWEVLQLARVHLWESVT